MSVVDNILEVLFIVLSILLFLAGVARVLSGVFSRSYDERGRPIFLEMSSTITRIERWHLAFADWTKHISIWLGVCGLIYFFSVSSVTIIHYIMAFIVVPRIFSQSLGNVQYVLRKDDVLDSLMAGDG